ncbi:hypothetical protein IT072_04360 [Leifsonia sp. ZF2019]|uniref:hypothetical protein n=1 Tax=Leifsonia sp. ZF2019 TaxID=2781978 RepID=UPI001CC11042|nr:hypothetical protein [Leifsonia sp. ZF2019]UAJ80286.1 hypothetical protein IT072_04360 [Leifsonia sp. ZF2019]
MSRVQRSSVAALGVALIGVGVWCAAVLLDTLLHDTVTVGAAGAARAAVSGLGSLAALAAGGSCAVALTRRGGDEAPRRATFIDLGGDDDRADG